MRFIDRIKERAKECKKTIVLPESEDRRTFVAAEKILKEGIANLIIIGDKEKEEGTVSVRMREKGDIGSMPLSEFAARVKKENDEKTVF